MPDFGEKHLHVSAQQRAGPSQVTHARKPSASVSKIVKKGNAVVFSPTGSYVENTAAGTVIGVIEETGTYLIDVEHLMQCSAGRE